MSGEAEVRRCIHEFLAARGVAGASSSDGVPDHFDMRRDGGLDSLGFLQLLGRLEQCVGRPVDLSDLDPQQLLKVGPLVTSIARQLDVNR